MRTIVSFVAIGMVRQLARLAVVILAAGALSGCVLSDYDISQQFKPTFPIAVGEYSSKDDTVIIKRFHDTYLTVASSPSSSDKARSYMRFFRVPEFDNYILQTWQDPEDGKNIDYHYYYASVAGDSFTVAVCCAYAALPQYLQNLVQENGNGNVIVLDGPRDALYVIREIGRRGLELSDLGIFTHK